MAARSRLFAVTWLFFQPRYHFPRKTWTDAGGELIELPGGERSEMLKTLSSVGADVSKDKPALSTAYQVVSEAAQRYQ